MNTITIGQGKEPLRIQKSMLMRHGVIAGATGTGKTITLKVIAEQLSEAGINVFLSDVKGDLSSLAQPLEATPDIQERLKEVGLTEHVPRAYPVTLWDIYGEKGIPLRTSITEMGPLLLSRLLDLNDTQSGLIDVAFRIADEEGYLLLDLEDLKAILGFMMENASALRPHYGNIAPSSVGAILRRLLSLEEQDANLLIGEPALQIADLLQKPSAEGMIHILQSQKLFLKPKLYSTLLLWLLSELFEELPEVGAIDQPKIVFFFDEAHLLFDGTSKALIEKIELMVRLIRSKGVGIFFVTQSPLDIPDEISSQLGNKIQHALRAYTPNELKNVRAISKTFREAEGINVEEAITSLRTGEAVVSVLDEKGIPTTADVAMIYPPKSKIGTLSEEMYFPLANQSPFMFKYKEPVNRESAYELLATRAELAAQEAERLALEKERAKLEKKKSSRMTPTESFARNIFGSAGREVGRQIIRGILGSLRK